MKQHTPNLSLSSTLPSTYWNPKQSLLCSYSPLFCTKINNNLIYSTWMEKSSALSWEKPDFFLLKENLRETKQLWVLGHLLKVSHCTVGNLIVWEEIVTCQLMQFYSGGKYPWLSRQLQLSDVPMVLSLWLSLCIPQSCSVFDSQHLPRLCSSVKGLYNTCLLPH